VLGPVIGGFFAGQKHIFGIAGWRCIFYINVPIGIVALIVVQAVLQIGHHRRDHRIDWWGAGALVLTLVPWLIVAEQGRTWGWGSGGAVACYLAGAVGLVAFLYIETTMGDEALLPLRLFRGRVFSIGSAQSFIVGMGMFGGLISIPLYLQIVKGASPTKSGLLVLPLVAGIMASSLLAGQVTSRTGRYKVFPIAGSILLVTGMALLTQVGADTPLWQTDLFMLVFGSGLGMNMQTLVLAMQNGVEPRDMGVATSAVTFFRQVGGSLGTAVFLSILFSRAATEIPHQLAKAGVRVPPGSVDLNDTANLHTLPPAVRHPILVGFSNAMDTVFLVGALVLVIGFVLSLLLPEVPLRMQSGLQAAREAAAAQGAPDPGGATHEPEIVAPTTSGPPLRG
jgi:MFS family permease